MDKQRKAKIIKQVKADRAARRLVEIENQTPRIRAKVQDTSKRDRSTRKQIPNTVRSRDDCALSISVDRS